jgi:SpoVK/Ycf46/Vps4 family AAA+-type ATPase
VNAVTPRLATELSPAEAAARQWSEAVDRLRVHFSALQEQRAPGAAVQFPFGSLLHEPRFAWLLENFDLDETDAALLAIAVATELDPLLARMLAEISGSSAASGLTAAQCMDALAPDVARRVAMRSRFAAEHSLFRHRLLMATGRSANDVDAARCGTLRIDPQVLGMLLYEPGIDPRLTRYCRLLQATTNAEGTPLVQRDWAHLLALARHARTKQIPLHLQFHGERGSGRRQTAEALAGALGLKLLVADAAVIAGTPDCAELLTPLFRQAWFSDALLYIDGVDTLGKFASGMELHRLLDEIGLDSGITILATPPQWNPGPRRSPVLTAIEFGAVARTRRQALWKSGLAAHEISGIDAEIIAERFRLTPAQIEGAIVHAQRHAAAFERAEMVTADDLISAARAQAPLDLSQLARKVQPVARWDDLVLPPDACRQLRELCARVTQRARVLDDWGFDAKLSLGKGTSALFAGSSGTGKTMATEVVAAELGLDLYKIDLAGIVSKYIGETEKNLDKVFTAARNANAVLLFDEADAIFGKRSEVRDSHDRYANLEISYLLQKMEEYEGLAILSTNLKQNLDDAFLRRLTYTVLFPFPDVADRERIWRRIWPPTTPLEPQIDFAALAQRFKLAGGNIKTAALAAAYFAADEGTLVGMRHLVHGVRRELQKVGKTLDAADIAGLIPLATARRPEALVG